MLPQIYTYGPDIERSTPQTICPECPECPKCPECPTLPVARSAFTIDIPRKKLDHKVWPIFAGLAVLGASSYFLVEKR